MMLCVDISNYTDPLTPDVLQQWKDAGIGLVIAQAFPPSYTDKYAEQRDQMRLVTQAGMALDSYIYDYLSDPTWRDGCLAGLDQAQAEDGILPRQVWADEEDTTTAAWSTDQTRAALGATRTALDAWCGKNSITFGSYTAPWWWVPRTGNWDSWSDLELWEANYDGQADTNVGFVPFGGWTQDKLRIKQYKGTSVLVVAGVDLNVLSDAEAGEITPAPAADCSGLVNALGYIDGDAIQPLRSYKLAKVKAVVAEIDRVAAQYGIK